jgi:uncharacterized membrane protein YphA (DoxX/SURF4 family)
MAEPLSAALVMRWLTAMAFVPHIVDKLLHPRNAIEFFEAAGLPAPRAMLCAAVLVEGAVVTSMMSGILPGIGAMIGAIFLAAAAICVSRVSRGKWLWNAGGAEYPAFLALTCATIAWLG